MQKTLLRGLLAALAGAGICPPVPARTLVNCKAPGKQDVTIELHGMMFEGKPLDCISGEFAIDLVPCAPPGGWSLSSGVGIMRLTSVVSRRQDYVGHLGGVTGHSITSGRIHFDEGFNMPGDGYEELRSFTVDRLTGEASLTQRGKPSGTYHCAAAGGSDAGGDVR